MNARRLFATFARYLHPRSAVRFWHTPVAPVRYDFPTLQDYYIDLRAKTRYRGPYDAHGIPVLDYFGATGRQYNPCAVAQWGLGAWQRWQRGEPAQAEPFRRAADWLLAHLEVDARGRGVWWYRFDHDAYGLRAPWASALAQAQGLQVLLRAARAFRDARYADAAARACAAMVAPVSEGGLRLEVDGAVLLEEALADRPTAILDGLMFAAFGLQDHCFAFPADRAAAELLARVYDSLERLLPRYDLGWWSRADLYAEQPPMPASSFYHGLHVAQLEVLAALTGRAEFTRYAERWDAVRRRPLNRARAWAAKAWFKLRHY